MVLFDQLKPMPQLLCNVLRSYRYPSISSALCRRLVLLDTSHVLGKASVGSSGTHPCIESLCCVNILPPPPPSLALDDHTRQEA